jgi:bifunctional DNA-binding transcriptional regulator/antitoxin component of YhaV-PrlF toxin-antitoxin module
MAILEKPIKYVKPQIKGMVTIPRSFREALNIDESTILEVKIYQNGVWFKKIEKDDDFEMYSRKRIDEFLDEDKLDIKTVTKLKKLLQ